MPERLPKRSTYVGLFMVTLSTLMYEIALTRIFSVTMWYHFAFVAISVALFGLTVGALLVHLLPGRFRDVDLDRHLWLFALLFGLSIGVCIAIQLSIKVVPRLTAAGVLSVMATCLVVSIPFVFSGIVVCLALTRFPTRVNRLYAADLIGAGLGCVVLVILFSRLDGPSLVVGIGALAASGAFAFGVGGAAGLHRRRRAVVAALAVAVLGVVAIGNAYLHSNGDAVLRVRWAKEVREPDHDLEEWNAFSRITVGDEVRGRPAGFLSPTFPEDTAVRQRGMVIDSTAGTVLTAHRRGADADFLRYDLTYLAHYLRSESDVAVIGVGGGRDVLAALEFGQRSVTGIEINGNILEAINGHYGDFTGHLDRDPRVTFVRDEARSYLARTDGKYDIIQMALIDTWAATSAGAYALSENSLYTTEAWDLFLDRLRPGGVLSVTRWYRFADQPPLETYRTTALAARALERRGVARPRDHILVYEGPSVGLAASGATILVSPDPFSRADLDRIGGEVERLRFRPILTPETAIDPPLRAIAAPGGPSDAVDRFDEDISPPTDNRPYFFQMADIETFLNGKGFGDDFVFRPVLVLLILGATVLVLASICIALPLLLDRRPRPPRVAPFYTYFAGIGFGFLLIEVSQLQRLSVFLGHPTYSLTVVLFSVLIFSGLGSMVTERFVRTDRPVSQLAPLVALLVVVVAFGIVTPAVVSSLDGATTPVRILVAVALLAPLAFPMGMPFAVGMRLAASRDGVPTAFLWGINGATSVCASVLGIVLSLFFGIATAFWVGALAYVVALASLTVLTRTRGAVPPKEAPEPDTGRAPVSVATR